MSNERLSDAIGDVDPNRTEFPTPERIKAGSATVVAMAVIEADLDVSLMDDAFWVSLWRERGVTRLAKLVWALVNQHRLADEQAPIWTERDVQSRIDASSLHAYLLAALRAYGQEDFADALEETLSRPKSEVGNAPAPTDDSEEEAPRPTPAMGNAPAEHAA
ncbi:hypothetical protein HN371_05645 [Candidatus Poribacteria bacterium]|jgi:hypothetical protein|nr:hypothetical protein [Candidatus Poribacteria bacterium]MBT5531900.1 hypothetical protein [Candidatus Poribacteria bacterium]MBT5714540.1 hypothetical protein [Candidatus Poribacteria bacterium]MBT7806266.1 hypothetical protein [Candidatus Poribacteria bacterium]